jgi:hypothetical protein
MSRLPTKYELATLVTAGNRILAAAMKIRRLAITLGSLTPDQQSICISRALDSAEAAGTFVDEVLGSIRKCRVELPPEGELPERPPPGIEP